MSNEEEKRCPLCAEEMDWTDQQLKPCQCGYQVCVWCWHHIMDMAEKEKTEARCPACRTPYDKEKIVGMETNCERFVTVTNRKHKPQKAKPKTNEGRTDLTNVRVIQRKMAYVIGLPLSLADEDLLQRKEYFGQYGRVSKVSLSRTASGAIQQFINDTCSAYITYSKEEEAIRCIQSVHGFVLEGRYLRASFGTAKYCHAWLRNMPCTNPTCLYLHNIGPEEDSFSKDEVAAVHTRNRVQQIVGATQYMQRRSGNVLPPPVDEPFSINCVSTGKEFVKSGAKDEALTTVTSSGHLACSLSYKDKDGSGKPPNKMTSFVDIVGRPCISATEKDGDGAEDTKILNLCSELSSVTIHKDSHLVAEYSDAMPCKISSSTHLPTGLPGKKEAQGYSMEPFREPLNLSASGIADLRPSDACFTKEQSFFMFDSGRPISHCSRSDAREDLVSFDDQRSKDSDSSSQTGCLFPSSYPVKDHSSNHAWQHKENCSLGDFDADGCTVHNHPHHVDEASIQVTSLNSIPIDGYNERKFQSSAESDRIFRCSNSFSNEEIIEQLRRLDNDNTTNDDNSALDAVESSIISNILSMDFDACDDSLALPHSLAEFFEDTDRRHGSSWNLNNSNQSGFSFAKQEDFVNQVTDLESSLSSIGHMPKNYSVFQSSMENKESYFCKPQHHGWSSLQHMQGNSVVSRAQSSTPPGFSMPSRQPPPGFSASERADQVLSATSGNHLAKTPSLPNNQHCALSKGNISHIGDFDFTDPAILVVGRGKPTNGLNISGLDTRLACPPQTSAYEEQAKLWLMMQQQQSTPAHQDPKISQFFRQEPPPFAHQELRHSGRFGDGFSPLCDTYGVSSRFADQHLAYNPSAFTQLSQQKFGNAHISNSFQPALDISNSFQPTLDELQRRNEVVGMAELQRNERLGFNKFFPGYGDLMLQMPSSGDVYSKVYGM